MTLDRPQKVIGPAAAAVNSSAAAGAVPMPAMSSTATSGISNSSGTLIAIPIVAAIATPRMSSPSQVVTVCGLSHCMANPLANPASIITGASRITWPAVILAHSLQPCSITSRHPLMSGAAGAWGSSNRPPSSCFRTFATSGPISRTPTRLTAMRVPPMRGANTIAAIIREGRLNVDEPCVMASVVSMPEPRLLNAEATGTMQAEQRFIAGPTSSPLREPRTPVPVSLQSPDLGKTNASVAPATRKAKIMPTVTSWR